MLLANIVRHEIRDVSRDGRFRWAAAVVTGLLLAALLTGWSHQRQISAEHASAEQMSRLTWLAQSSKDPHSAAHYGAYVFKPRGPLTLFDSGIDAYAGVAAWLEAHKQNEFQFRPAQDRASMARLGQLTAAGTLQFLMPVVIVLLVFRKFAGEREDGTLRQLVAAGVSPRVLALGKAAGVAATLALVLVPATMAGAMALLWTSGAVAVADSGSRVAGLVIVYGLYFGIFVALGLCASAMLKKSSHALAVLVAFWVLNAVVAPRAASDVSRRLHPTPTAFEFAERVRHDTYDGLPVHAYNVRRAADLRKRLLDEYHVARIEDLPVNFRGIDYLEREAHSNAVWEKHYGRLWDAFEQQTAVHQRGGLVAPFMAVRALSMSLAGVDFFHHQHFASAAESYRRRLVFAMNRDLAYSGSSAQRGAYATDAALWAAVPPFEYRTPDLAWALEQVRSSVLGLGAWLVLAVLALTASVRRLAVE
jgi:ABC-2 type transport system permease protein